MSEATIFQRSIAQYALNRGLSRASVMYVLASVGASSALSVKPEDRPTVYRALEEVPPEMSKNEASRKLCYCSGKYPNAGGPREDHKKRCEYVLWRDLIGEPLESIYGEEAA